MHILIITPTLPVPTSGGRTRVYNLIKHLAAHHQITVLSFLQPADQEWLATLEPYCTHLELVPFAGFKPSGKWANRIRGWAQILFSRRPRYVHTFPVETIRETLRSLLDRQYFDIVVFEFLYLVELVNEIDGIPTLLVEHNVENDIQKRLYETATGPVYYFREKLLWCKLSKFERDYLQKFPSCIAVSERDAALLREMSPTTNVHLVPNGVDSKAFRPAAGLLRANNTLLFFGTLNYTPNVEGIVWFVHEILPHIREIRPGVELQIVGMDPAPAVTALAQLPGVSLVGFVPDIRERLWSATACVVPLLTGGGTRLKILEALAAGCPVVSTTIGAEGLDLKPGEHLLIADTAEDFAARVVTLLDSPALQQELAHRGQKSVAARYDWAIIARKMDLALQKTVESWRSGGTA